MSISVKLSVNDSNNAYSLNLTDRSSSYSVNAVDDNESVGISADSNQPKYVGARAYVEQTDEGAVITCSDYSGTTTAIIKNGTTSDLNWVQEQLDLKVDKETGKALSTNDFTAEYKTRLDGLLAMTTTEVNSIWDKVFTE